MKVPRGSPDEMIQPRDLGIAVAYVISSSERCSPTRIVIEPLLAPHPDMRAFAQLQYEQEAARQNAKL